MASAEHLTAAATVLERPLTWKSLLIGVLIAVIINIFVPLSAYRVHSSRFVHGQVTTGVLIPFIVLLMVVNPLLRLFGPRIGLSRSEMLFVFVMGLIAAAMPNTNLAGHFLAIMMSPFYYATPENKWAEYFHQAIPKWITPAPTGNVVRGFFEGLRPGETIPWGAWVMPLFWWTTLFVAIVAASLGIVVILRRQWVEHEKLTFPLAEVPLQMVAESEKPGIVPAILKSKLFWIGFAIPFLIRMWNIATYFYPWLPGIGIGDRETSIRFGPNFPDIAVKTNFFVIGFAYLAPLEILFSVWFFHLLANLQIGLQNKLGYHPIEGVDTQCSYQSAELGWQAFGGLAFIACWAIWLARRHLREVWRKVWREDYPLDDSGELMRYRTALLLVVWGLAYIFFWLWRSGMSPGVAALFILVQFIIFLAISKIAAMSGLVYLRATLSAQGAVMGMVGTANMSVPSMTATVFSLTWYTDYTCFVMPRMMHAAKIGDAIRARRRAILLAMLLGAIIGGGVAVYYTICLAYEHGAFNFDVYTFTSGNRSSFDSIVSHIKNPRGVGWTRMEFMGIGAVITALLTFLRQRFVWWPLHPVGFTISTAWCTRVCAYPAFFVWLIKLILIKIGGVELFRKFTPFFIGMLLGFCAGVGVAFVVDLLFFFGQGHRVYAW